MAPMVKIAEDGQSATGTFSIICALTIRDEKEDEDAYVEIGKYKNDYVKVDGQWKIKKMYGNMEKASLWSQGWVPPFLFHSDIEKHLIAKMYDAS